MITASLTAVDYSRLLRLVLGLKYKPGWEFYLAEGSTSGSGSMHMGAGTMMGSSAGALLLTTLPVRLLVDAATEDSRGGGAVSIQHTFAVPPGEPPCGWERWLLDMVLLVERHEAMEFFEAEGERVFFPEHGPEADPYRIEQRARV